MSTDRKELNDAIDSVSRAIDGCPNYWDRENTMKVLRTLRAATRAHLETLPKPVWRVTAWLQKGTNRRAAPFDAYSLDAALDFARDYLKQGMRFVNVQQVQS